MQSKKRFERQGCKMLRLKPWNKEKASLRLLLETQNKLVLCQALQGEIVDFAVSKIRNRNNKNSKRCRYVVD